MLICREGEPEHKDIASGHKVECYLLGR
jgi:hypothetical protein